MRGTCAGRKHAHPRKLCPMLEKAILTLCLLCTQVAFAQQSWGTRPNGSQVTSLADPATRVVVLFFVASDCPVSNRTFPEMQRLREKFAFAGASFWYVYPNQGEKAIDVAAHQASFDAHGAAMLSPGPELVRLVHAVATPEVSVLEPNGTGGWHPVYTGRVDNRYVRLGLERTQVTERYAEQAIQAALAGHHPSAPVGGPVGCAILNPGVARR